MVSGLTIRLRVSRVYRGVPYSIEADLHEVKSVDLIGRLMRKAESFIDKMLEEVEDA